MSWTKDKRRADAILPQIEALCMTRLGRHFVGLRVGSDEEDRSEATDYVIQIVLKNGSKVACRVRFDTHYRDWTVRYWRASGAKTEYEKLVAGHADYYLYLWVEDGQIVDWILVDLNQARTQGVFEGLGAAAIPNRDGQSSFVPVPLTLLRATEALVDASTAMWYRAEGADL